MRYVIIFLFILPFSGIAQCDLDRHNTSELSGWISCEVAPNPNGIRGNGHWIMYDFTFDYFLEQLVIWNHNHPETLNYGVQDIVIDISTDGENWTEVAALQVPQGTGFSRYAGHVGPLVNQRARYMIISGLSNYGGTCTAISEIRIGVLDEILCQNYASLSGDLGNKKYYATEFINTDGLVNSNKIVHFQSGEEVNILEGFEAKINSELLVQIEPCNN